MRMVKHSRSSQNSNFAMSLQYIKKELRDKNYFLHADNIKVSYNLISTFWASEFQGDTTIIDGHDQAFAKYSK